MKVQTFYYRYKQFLEKVIIDFSCKKYLKTIRKSQKSQKSSMTSTLNAHISVSFASQGLKFSGYMPKRQNFVTKVISLGTYPENFNSREATLAEICAVKVGVKIQKTRFFRFLRFPFRH